MTRPKATLHTWFIAARPKTLTASLAPVAVGTALASQHGKAHIFAAIMALFGAMFIQIGTNYANDLFDFKKGADDQDRLGPQRVTSAGLVTPRQIAIATTAAMGAALLCGIYLVSLTGWPLLILGLLSIACGIAYTGGPFPLAYNALGDVFVFIFFGLVATAGTYYVQALEVHGMAIAYGAIVGATGVALLIVNNLRDMSTDKKHEKITTAVLLGPARTRLFYVLILSIAYLIPVALVLTKQAPYSVLLCLLTVPLSIATTKNLYASHGAALNAVLGQTASIQLSTGLLLAMGVLWNA